MIVSTEELKDALSLALITIPSKPISPVTACIRVQADAGELVLETNSYATGYKTSIPCKGDFPQTVLPGQELIGLIGNITAPTVEILATGDGYCQLRSDTVGGRKKTVRLQVVALDFMSFSDTRTASEKVITMVVNGEELDHVLTAAAAIVSEKTPVLSLTGIGLQILADKIDVYGATEYYMMLQSLPVDSMTNYDQEKGIRTLVIPIDMAQALKGNKLPVTLTTSGYGNIIAQFGQTTYFQGLIEVAYPKMRVFYDYINIDELQSVDLTQIKSALKDAGTIGTDRIFVSLQDDGVLSIRSQSEIGEVENFTLWAGTKQFETLLSTTYLQTLLNTVEKNAGSVRIGVSGPKDIYFVANVMPKDETHRWTRSAMLARMTL
jgi:DNA polymerase III sliding clamp (beta) subunit (PCNA family)